MGEVLDQSEVDALLAAVEGGEIEVQIEEPQKAAAPVALYDWKRPEKVAKDQLRALEFLHEGFARNFSASLSGLLRTISDVRLETVDQLTYAEFIMSLPNPTCFTLLSCEPLEGNIILEINPSIVFPIFDRLMGGGKTPSTPPERPLTDIEWRLMSTILDRATEQLSATWNEIQKIDFKVVATESNPQLMQVVAPNEAVVLICFDMTMGEHGGLMNLCIPYRVIEPLMGEVAGHALPGFSRKGAVVEKQEAIAEQLGGAELTLVAVLARTKITVKDLLNLEVGDQLDLEHPATSPIWLEVDGKPRFLAKPGTYKRRVAVKILGPAAGVPPVAVPK